MDTITTLGAIRNKTLCRDRNVFIIIPPYGSMVGIFSLQFSNNFW